MLKSAGKDFCYSEETQLVLLRLKSIIFLVALLACGSVFTGAQTAASSPSPTPTPETKKDNKQTKTDPSKNPTAEQVAESAIFIYGGFAGGRPGLNQIRKSAVERGKVVLKNADGTSETATYEKRILRGENLEKERVRIDQEFANSRFSLIYKDAKIIGLFNDSVFTPGAETATAFTNQIWRGLEGLLRYKENESTLNLIGKEKFMGVEYFLLDIKDKSGRTTRYFISAKSFRVMWLEYTEGAVKYTRKFYDHRWAQGTLVPYRSVLLENGKEVEESNILTVTYGQKIEDDIFQTS